MADTNPETFQARRLACIQEIKDIITHVGAWSVNKTLLAKKHGFNRISVDRWFDKIIAQIPREKIENITSMGDASIKIAMSVCEKILADPSAKVRDKLEAVARITDTLKHYTEFLEAYGLKPKMADEIKLTGELDLARLMRIAEESKGVVK